ncbi:hypothetical protein BVX94_02430, partial [bacterium B17]
PNESVSLSGDDITDPGEDDDNGFWIHDGTNGLYQVEYELDGDYLERAVPEGTGKMFRNDDGRLEIRDLDIEFMPSSDDPQYATIEFDIYTKDKGIEHTMAFSTRAFLVNKHRYYHEQEDE